MSSLEARLTALLERIARAAEKSGRKAADITLLAVSKTFPVEAIQEAIHCGLTRFGESRIQEALPKMDAIGPGPEWHFIGHLQRNKVNRAVGAFALIHSVDSLPLAERMECIAAERGLVQPVLIEVNTAREAQKHGVAVEQAEELARAIGQLPHLRLTGLMGMAPYSDDPERARPVFRELSGLFQHIARQGYHGVRMQTLSMGMSGDFEVAVEEGATLVRVGGALFGARN